MTWNYTSIYDKKKENSEFPFRHINIGSEYQAVLPELRGKTIFLRPFVRLTLNVLFILFSKIACFEDNYKKF